VAAPEAFDDGQALCEHELEGRGEAATQPLPVRRARLDQGQEPPVLALGVRARGRDSSTFSLKGCDSGCRRSEGPRLLLLSAAQER